MNGEQIKELHQALIEAFPKHSDLERMVSFGLSENLAAIAQGADLGDTIFNLIRWAEARGRVKDLLHAAQEANPTNPNLQRTIIQLQAQQVASAQAQQVADARVKRSCGVTVTVMLAVLLMFGVYLASSRPAGSSTLITPSATLPTEIPYPTPTPTGTDSVSPISMILVIVAIILAVVIVWNIIEVIGYLRRRDKL